jgi:hypothetical protein
MEIEDTDLATMMNGMMTMTTNMGMAITRHLITRTKQKANEWLG